MFLENHNVPMTCVFVLSASNNRIFVPVCINCKYIATVFFINHVLNVMSNFNVPSHAGTVLHRFSTEHMECLICSLERYSASTATSIVNIGT